MNRYCSYKNGTPQGWRDTVFFVAEQQSDIHTKPDISKEVLSKNE